MSKFRIQQKHLASLVVSLGLTVSLGACSTSGIGLGNDNGNNVGDGIGQNESLTNNDNTTTVEPLSPFDEFRSILWGLGRDDESRLRQFEADRVVEENMIAQCMHELGFDYIPNFEAVSLTFRTNDNWRPNDPDWIAQYGYGWVVEPESGRPAPGGSIGVHGGMLGPNAAIVAELSETEASAWNDALWNMGAGFERDAGGGVITRDCFNWARMTVNHQHFATQQSDEFAPLMESISRMQDDLRFGISDADRAWANCMAESGFTDLNLQWEASDRIMLEWGDTRNTVHNDPEWREQNPNINDPTPENSEIVAELHQREVALATADHNCQISTNFAANREAHISAVENQFITDHRVELEALRSALEQQ